MKFVLYQVRSVSGNQGISRLLHGTCREILDLSIGDRLICKFDTGGY